MKKTFILIVLFIFGAVFLLSCQQQSKKSDSFDISSGSTGKVMARVGGTAITEEEIKARQSHLSFGLKSENRILNNLISNRLLYLAAKKDKIDQEPIVKQRIQNQTEKIMGQFYLNKYVNSLGLSEKDIKDYYDKHKEDFKVLRRAIIAHLVTADRVKSISIMKDILDGKMTFDQAVKKYSTDKNTIRSGGRLGSVQENKYIPLIGKSDEISKAIFGAKKGAIVGPFKSRFGYELIKIISFAKEKYNPLERVRRKIIDTLAVSEDAIKEYYEKNKEFHYKSKAYLKVRHIQLKTKKAAEVVLKRLKSGENFVKLVHEVSQDKYSIKKDGDLGIIYSDGYIPRFGTSKEFIKAIFKLKVGELSPVLKTNAGYHIVMVYKKVPAKYRTLALVKQNIIANLANKERRKRRKEIMKKLEQEFGVTRLDNK